MACKIGVAILFARGVQLDNGVISPSVQGLNPLATTLGLNLVTLGNLVGEGLPML